MNALAAVLHPFGGRSARQLEKEAQINGLLVGFHGNADFRHHKPDQKSYEVLIRHSNKTFSTLVIRIPETFPDARPDIVVKGHLSTSGHPWIASPYGTIKGCQRLNDWNKSVSSLNAVVKEIVAMLEAAVAVSPTPTPSLLHQDSSSPSASPSPFPAASASSSSSSSSSPSQQQQQQQQQQRHGTVVAVNVANPLANPNLQVNPMATPNVTSMATNPNPTPAPSSSSRTAKPAVPASFPNLQHLSDAQLERMLRDDVAIQASLQTLAEVASLREYRDELRKKNQAAAERSLKRYEECERTQREVIEAQQELHALASDYAAKLAAKKRLVLTEKEVLARAEAHCRALDAGSMRVREKLFAGAVPPEGLRSFLQEFLQARTEYYVLKGKLDSIPKPSVPGR